MRQVWVLDQRSIKIGKYWILFHWIGSNWLEENKRRISYLTIFGCLDEGEAIEAELTKKTNQETVPNIFIKQQHMGGIWLEFSRRWTLFSVGGCDSTLAALKSGRVAALLNPPKSKAGGDQREKDDLDSYDYDLIVIGGGSGGLACSKVCAKKKNPKNSSLKKKFDWIGSSIFW